MNRAVLLGVAAVGLSGCMLYETRPDHDIAEKARCYPNEKNPNPCAAGLYCWPKPLGKELPSEPPGAKICVKQKVAGDKCEGNLKDECGATACFKEDPKAKLGVCQEPPPPPKLCNGEPADIGAFLKSLASEPAAPAVALDAAALAAQDAPPSAIKPAPMLNITAAAITLDGQPIDVKKIPAQLGLALTKLAQSQAKANLDASLRGHLLVAVAKDAPWSTVAAAMQVAMKAGFLQVAFPFARKPVTAAPGASAIDADLAALRANPAQKAEAMQTMPAKVFAECPQAVELMPKLAQVEPAKKAEALAAELPAAVEQCSCKVDVASVKALAWEMFAPAAPVGAVELSLAKPTAKGAPAVTAAPTATWADAHARVLEAAQKGEPVVFQAKK